MEQTWLTTKCVTCDHEETTVACPMCGKPVRTESELFSYYDAAANLRSVTVHYTCLVDLANQPLSALFPHLLVHPYVDKGAECPQFTRDRR